MRSNEIAQLAGVTVRTLRHYHAIGLLPEPPRAENGYREYEADHLVRLLRIKRLTTLGFSLDRVGAVLSEMDESLASSEGPRADDALDELDRELALQIERLQEQRRTIALLKSEQLDPDLPVQFARAAKPLIETAYAESSFKEGDREALLIAGHLYTEQDVKELERTVAALSERGLLDQLRTIQTSFDELAADAPRNEINRMVDEALSLLEPVIDCFDPTNWEQEVTQAELFIDEISRRGMNEAQVYAQERIWCLLEERILARKETPPPDASTIPPQPA